SCQWSMFVGFQNMSASLVPPSIFGCPSSVILTNIPSPPSLSYSSSAYNSSFNTSTYYTPAGSSVATIAWPYLNASDSLGVSTFYYGLGQNPKYCGAYQVAGA